jgi:hypothetical protein
MDVALWIVAGLLAAVLLISTSKAFVPREKLVAVGGAAAEWVEDFSPRALRAIATLELLAAVGLILPAALDIAPVLVPLAATGAALLFIGAVTMRLRRGERERSCPTWSISPWPYSWRGAASAPSPSPADGRTQSPGHSASFARRGSRRDPPGAP